MSRLNSYIRGNDEFIELNKKVNMPPEAHIIHQLTELNISLAMVADHLGQISNDLRSISREIAKRK